MAPVGAVPILQQEMDSLHDEMLAEQSALEAQMVLGAEDDGASQVPDSSQAESVSTPSMQRKAVTWDDLMALRDTMGQRSEAVVAVPEVNTRLRSTAAGVSPMPSACSNLLMPLPVSYTHLTLPTICSV